MCKKIKAWFKSLFGKKEECKCKCECTCEKEKEVVTEIPVQPQKPQEPQPKPYDNEEQKPTEPANKPNKKIAGDPKAPKQTPQKSEKEIKETKPVEEVNKKETNKEETNKEENKNVIAPKQFFRNKDLVTYTIKNETEIGDSAFYGCINLEQLIIKTKKVPKLGKEAIHTRVNRKLVVIPKLQILVPEKMIDKYKNNKVWGKYADRIKPIVK